MSDFAPETQAVIPPGAMPSALDHLFPPEKERVDAAPPKVPKHEFEVEDRRHTDWRRRRAAVIDGVLLFGFFYVIGQAIKGYLGASLLAISLWLTYFFVAETATGQTIGKRMSRLQVVMRDGRPATAKAVAARTVLRLIDGLPFAWMIGGLVMLLTGGRRQRLGDLAAHTVVRNYDPYMPRAPHSPLLGVYPILWIGVSLFVMWQVNLIGAHAPMPGHRTSNPYMAEVDKICERRINREVSIGVEETRTQVMGLWAARMGAIDSMPDPPPSARHDMRIVRSEVRGMLRAIGLEYSKASVSTDPRKIAAADDRLRKRFHSMQKQFRKLGLPYCALGIHTTG